MPARPQLAHPTLVHPRTGAPLTAVGWFRGRPIWPVLGGDGTDDGGQDGAADPPADGDPKPGGDDDPLREEGKQAIQRMKDREKAARSALRPWTSLATQLGVKTPEELKALLDGKQAGATEADADKIRREAEAAVMSKANKRIVRAEVKTVAADLFADADDAPRYLDLDQYEVDDSGEVDADQIRDDLRALLERKPHLAKPTSATPPAPRNPKPDPAQGSKAPAPPRNAVNAGADLYRARHPEKTTT